MSVLPHAVVIGSGIAGLSSAWHLLGKGFRVTVLEAAGRLGGHTHTRVLTFDGHSAPVDTGFIVFNHRTYPEFRPWLAELGVRTQKTDMSFSVSAREGAFEWSGQSLRTVFAQLTNAFRPRFLRMLLDILRFHREAPRDRAALAERGEAGPRLGDYLDQNGYSQGFAEDYLLPMAGAIWSCPSGQMREFPFASFVAFCENHGLLQVSDRPPWYCLPDGSSSYITALQRRLEDQQSPVEFRLSTPAIGLSPCEDAAAGRWEVQTPSGPLIADVVVLACHSDQSARLLEGAGPTAAPLQSIASRVRYQPNTAYLHTDRALMPRRELAWAAWNYRAEGRPDESAAPVAVTYWMNRLQSLPFTTPVLVTLNPLHAPRQEHILETLTYDHPVLDDDAVAAQQEAASHQGLHGLALAGAWLGYGFHEDGFRSGRLAAEALARSTETVQ